MASNMKNKNSESKNIEQEIFKVLEHQIRRNILKFVGETKNPTFTDILQAVKMADSPTLSYHLKTPAPFIEQQNGNYQLTPIGQDAYSLLLKTAAYNKLIFHMGMTLTEEEHKKWHEEHHEMVPEMHNALMKKWESAKKKIRSGTACMECLQKTRTRQRKNL
jgi:DNA-binding transcriptional ArsR family regulator